METAGQSLWATPASDIKPPAVFKQLYSREYAAITKALLPVTPAIILFGLLSNFTNIVVFLKAGVKDNVTILLFSLALSDLTFLILITPLPCAFVILLFNPGWVWPFDPSFLTTLTYWPAYTAYDLSTYISVSLGVLRCACVAMPLKFKAVFTNTRTILCVLFLAALSLLLRIPVLTVNRVAWRTSAMTNVSSPYVTSVNTELMFRINDILNRGCMIWISYVVMIVCVCLLSVKLHEAAKVRKSCTSNAPQSPDQKSEKPAATSNLSAKDFQVIKSVVLVCTIFILSHLPFMVYSTARLINPVTFTSKWFYLFRILAIISQLGSYLNVSVNIFVYYNCNSKYRSVFLSLVLSK